MRILYIEPFNKGSHAAFTGILDRLADADWTVLTLPGRHWKAHMRTGAAWAAGRLVKEDPVRFDLILASSYLPLAELKGLVPALSGTPSVLYFHENQLAYPSRTDQSPLETERDLHYGFTQIVSAASATRCVFNSRYNLESFCAGARKLLEKMPDVRIEGLVDRIRAASTVLSVPVELPDPAGLAFDDVPAGPGRHAGPLILWNHRWEHDKNPEGFFKALSALIKKGVPFRVAVCGQQYRKTPAVFADAQKLLGDRIVHWGYIPERPDYLDLLERAQIAISTSRQEFMGISMIEAAHMGASPLVPDRLSYPEIFPADHRYAEGQLADRLAALCRTWSAGNLDLRQNRTTMTLGFGVEHMAAPWTDLLSETARAD